MKKLFVSVLICLLIGIFTPSTFAQEPTPGSAQENACNDGGAMWRENPEDACTTEWHWTCGWYLARFFEGSLGRANFPTFCASVLPPLPPPSEPVAAPSASSPGFPSAGCILHTGIGFYMNFNGGFSVPANAVAYLNPSCSAPFLPFFAWILVYAPPPFDPSILCQAAGASGATGLWGNDMYHCF